MGAVYSDTDASLGGADKTIKVSDVDGDFHLFKRKKTGTWVNAMQFYQAWKDMKTKGSTTGSNWVVKVDIDSVFPPDRLIKKLNGYHVPQGGVYIDNCAKVRYGFFGNLEVVSQDAFATFLGSLETCKASLDWKGLDPDWKLGHMVRICLCRCALTRRECPESRTTFGMRMVPARTTYPKRCGKSRV